MAEGEGWRGRESPTDPGSVEQRLRAGRAAIGCRQERITEAKIKERGGQIATAHARRARACSTQGGALATTWRAQNEGEREREVRQTTDSGLEEKWIARECTWQSCPWRLPRKPANCYPRRVDWNKRVPNKPKRHCARHWDLTHGEVHHMLTLCAVGPARKRGWDEECEVREGGEGLGTRGSSYVKLPS